MTNIGHYIRRYTTGQQQQRQEPRQESQVQRQSPSHSPEHRQMIQMRMRKAGMAPQMTQTQVLMRQSLPFSLQS